MNASTIIFVGLAILSIVVFISTIKIVPQRSAYIVECFGKYRTTLLAGFHIVIPFADKIAYKHVLKEQVMDVAAQVCITKDNISVEVDGVLGLGGFGVGFQDVGAVVDLDAVVDVVHAGHHPQLC